MTKNQVRQVQECARRIGAAVARFYFDGGRCSPVLNQALFRCRAWLKPNAGYSNFRRVDFHVVSHAVARTFCDLNDAGGCYE